jgi:uncharacterized protein YdeI (YjbR/CyaY-like superfamily)
MLESRISKVLRCHPVPRQREWVVAMFFETGDEFAAWLEKHGAGKSERIVGYYKRGTRRPSLSWPESVDAALCFGWIDGVRKRIDEHSFDILPRLKAEDSYCATHERPHP